MTIQEKITEAFDYLREDLSYVAMIGVVEYGDIDPNKFKKQDVEEQSFNHEYNWSEIYDEDCGRGEFLIPFYDDVYMWFEYNS